MSYVDEALRALLRRLCVQWKYAAVGIFGSWQLCLNMARPRGKENPENTLSSARAVFHVRGPYMPREVEAAGDLLAEAK